MSTTTTRNPLIEFTDELVGFARGERRGIRNPFVMVPVEPSIETRVARRLVDWTTEEDAELADWHDVVDTDGEPLTVTHIRLDKVLPQTTVFQTCNDLGPLEHVTSTSVEETMERNLATEMIDRIIQIMNDQGIKNDRVTVLLLLNLGSLYPFTRASELLDELDRKNINTTIGIPFPGSVIGGRLSFFNESARHYYPAHRIDTQIHEGWMTDV